MAAVTNRIEKSHIFSEIKKCIETDPKGFYMRIGDRPVLIRHIEADDDHVFRKYSKYGIALLESAANPSVTFFSVSNISITEGQAVYYVGFSDETGVFMCHKGRISSIQKDENDVDNFTIDGPKVSNYPGSPVFTYDKVDGILNLTGFIALPDEDANPTDKAIHAHLFEHVKSDELEEIERGGITVSNGNFKGRELRKPGGGPRSMVITGPNLHVTYNLGNPHNIGAYNNGNKFKTKFYQAALNSFVNKQNGAQVPDSFTFIFDKEEQTAIKQ